MNPKKAAETTVIKFSHKDPEALFRAHQRNRGTNYPADAAVELVIYESKLLGWNCVAHGANAIPQDLIEKLQLTEVLRKPLADQSRVNHGLNSLDLIQAMSRSGHGA